jgi:transposase
MRPISDEKRQMIIEAKKRGETEKTILTWIKDISRSSITKIYKQYQKTGNHKPKPCPGSKNKLTPKQDQQIKEQIKQTPDITLNELIDKLDLTITQSGLSKQLKQMGLTFKKRHFMQTDKNDLMSSKNASNGAKYKKP